MEPTSSSPPEFSCKVLYRFSRDKLDSEKKRVMALEAAPIHDGNHSNQEELAAELSKVQTEQEQRERKRLEERELWRRVYPALALDGSIG